MSVLDVRSRELFAEGHLEGSTNIPFDRFGGLLCALPPRDREKAVELSVLAGKREELDAVCEVLEQIGYRVVEKMLAEDAELCARGESVALWQPNEFLRKVAERLPLEGTMLDVASGSCRDCVFMAQRGWRTVGVDWQEKLLKAGENLAALHGVRDKCDFVLGDVGEVLRRPEHFEKYDAVNVCRFLERSLMREGVLQRVVKSGGFVVYQTFMAPCRKPCHPKHVLEKGELKTLFEGWNVLCYEESALGDGRNVQCLLAQKP